MQYLFSPVGRTMLEAVARRRVLVALDFDGTLAPIVSDPSRASLRAPTYAHLRRLARLLPCAVISGRSRADVRRRLGPLRLAFVAGNHGIEPSQAAAHAVREVARWKPLLVQALAGFDGAVLEDKRLSMAVHYRAARNKPRVRAAVRRAAAALGGVRLVAGRQVVNLVPQGAPHKGTAVARARRRLGCEAILYVGDDDTDEDVFSLVDRCPLLSVRIGRTSKSAAQFYLRSQEEVDAMLWHLACAVEGDCPNETATFAPRWRSTGTWRAITEAR